MGSFHRIQTEAWLRSINVKADRVLDVGGAQYPIKGRTKSWEVGNYKILDLPVPHENNYKYDYKIDLNFRPVASDWFWHRNDPAEDKNRFDVAFCIEVSEYWYNPFNAVCMLNDMLNKDGLLYITFPFIYMAHKPTGTDFLRYTPTGAEKLLKEAGFEILEHKYRKATSDKLDIFWREEKMKGLHGVDHEIIGSLITAKKI